MRSLAASSAHGTSARQRESCPGLFRREPTSTGPAGTVSNMFADLRRISRGEIIAENPDRSMQGARLEIDHAEGHATWEFYRLDDDLYVATADGVYDVTRIEVAPGEGLLEFHFRLSGVLEISNAQWPQPLTVKGPTLLILHQPPGVDVIERLSHTEQDSCVSLYCGLHYLFALMRRAGIPRWPLVEEIARRRSDTAWYREVEMSPMMHYIGKSLLECPFRGGLRLLHAESKALELLCEILATAQDEATANCSLTSQSEARQLNAARRLIGANVNTPLGVRDIAQAVGMSHSKLKRAFKERYGVTVCDYSLERRMHHALDLLRCKRMSVGQVAHAVGYRHQTSFASAFHDFFGFQPSKARTEMR